METKQSKSSQVVLIAVIALIGLGTMFVNASDKWWNPPGPPGPTMKSLDEVEARIPVQSLSGSGTALYVISQSGSYYLTGNITGEINKHGIKIDANNVTVDLNGYVLTGPGKAVGDSGHGIFSGYHRITILDGSVSNWRESGIQVGDHCRISSITAIENGIGGIYVGKCSLITKCRVKDNQNRGISCSIGTIVSECTACYNALGIFSEECSIFECTAYYNNGYGIYGKNGSINNCYARRNAQGIVAEGGVVNNCSAASNSDYGIGGSYGTVISDCVVRKNDVHGIKVSHGCLVIKNSCRKNGGIGDGAGIYAEYNDNRIEGNNVIENGWGIYVEGSGNLIIKNSASGSGTTDYYIDSGNDVGPIGSAGTSTSPWANISF